MGRPKQFQRLSHEAIETAACQAESASDLARRLKIDGSKARRWISTGKVRLGSRPLSVVPLAPPPARDVAPRTTIDTAAGALHTPVPSDDWAARLRRDFELTPQHDRVLTLAERAYQLRWTRPRRHRRAWPRVGSTRA